MVSCCLSMYSKAMCWYGGRSYVVIQPVGYCITTLIKRFNTSYVVIQRIARSFLQGSESFNTSYVVIQRRRQASSCANTRVSIHRMLLFNGKSANRSKRISFVSIHRMLLFNYERRFRSGMDSVSIHRMLLFNLHGLVCVIRGKWFQYIVCCYSTGFTFGIGGVLTVFQYIVCCYSTYISPFHSFNATVSIHRMLLFNLMTL